MNLIPQKNTMHSIPKIYKGFWTVLYFIMLFPLVSLASESATPKIVEANCGLRAEILVNKIPTCGEKDGSVTLNVTGATGNIIYSWGPSATRDDLASGFYCIVISDEAGCLLLVDFTLGDCPDCDKFEAEIFVQNLPSCNQADGVAVFSIMAANGMPTFSWGPSIKREDLRAGTYAVSITDQEGCLKVVDFELTDNCFQCEDLEVTAVINRQPSAARNDGSVCLEMNGGTGKLRHNMGAFDCYDNLYPGNYRILVSDSLCSTWVNFSLKEPIVNLSATPVILNQPSCTRKDGAVRIEVSGAVGTVKYDWGLGNFKDNLTPGNYSVIVSDEISSVRVNFTLEEPASGPCCPLEVVSKVSAPSCLRNDGEVCLEVSNATGDVSYNWGAGACKDGYSPGTYAVEVADELCSIRETFVMEKPDYNTCCTLEADFQILQQPTCDNTVGSVCIEVKGANGSVTYDWGPNSCYNNLSPGNYAVVVSDRFCSVVVRFELQAPDYDICCNLTASAIINQHPKCENFNGSVRLATSGARGQVRYSWGVKDQFDNLAPGYYSVLVSDEFCSVSVPFILEKQLAECPCTLKTNLAITKVPDCNNPFASACIDVFSAVGNVTYSWGDGQCKEDLSPGEYTIIVSDSLCTDTIAFTIEPPICCFTASVNITEEPTCDMPFATACIEISDAVGEVTYSWGEEECQEDISPGSYTVIVSDSLCMDTIPFTVDSINCCQPNKIFFPNAFSPNGDNKNDRLFIRGTTGFDQIELIIYNRWGQKVFETNNPTNGWDGTFKGEPVKSDVYGYYLTVTCPTEMKIITGNVTVLN